MAKFCEEGFEKELWFFKIHGGGYLSSIGNKIIAAVSHENRLQVIDENGKIQYIGREGVGMGEFLYPIGMTVHANKIYIADNLNRRIQVLTPDFKYFSNFKTNFRPRDIIYHGGYFYISDFDGKLIHQFTEMGQEVKTVGSGFLKGPHSMVWDANANHLIVTDNSGQRLRIFNKQGQLLKSSMKVMNPHEILIDSNSDILVTEHTGHILRVFDSNLDPKCEKALPYGDAYGLAILPNCSLAISNGNGIHVYPYPRTTTTPSINLLSTKEEEGKGIEDAILFTN